MQEYTIVNQVQISKDVSQKNVTFLGMQELIIVNQWISKKRYKSQDVQYTNNNNLTPHFWAINKSVEM